MNVLLIQPRMAPASIAGDDFYVFEPLALEYLAAGLQDKHLVRILDMRFDDDLGSVLEELRPGVVGITAYTIHVNTTLRLFRQVKAFDPRTLTVVGGHHATVRPEDFRTRDVDRVVVGEGVFAMREIVDRHSAGLDTNGIPGVLAERNGETVASSGCSAVDLDALPFPDRSATARYRDRYFSEWMKPLASIRTSKGCPFRCRHCALWKTSGGAYLRRSPESIVAELSGIREEFVFFADDESLLDVRRMTDLAAGIARSGIRKRYFLYARSDTIVRHPDLLRAWRDIGLERVFVGLEFFRDEDMAYVGKASTVDENERALGILSDLGIEAYANFMVRPEFSLEDFRAYRRYCRRLPLNFAGFTVLTPLPGTDLYEDRKDEIVLKDWDLFDFLHSVLPTALPPREFYQELADLMGKAVPLRRALSFFAKFPLPEIPGLLGRSFRVLRKVRGAYKDRAL